MSSAAAVHLRSPIQTSSRQNPSSIPDATSHPPFDHSACSYAHFSESGESLNSSSFGNASGLGFAPVFAQPGLSGAGSTASSRSKPRLVNLRKQSASQHARSRSRTATGESSSGFNPFPPTVGSSDQVNSNSASNGFMESPAGAENGPGAGNSGSLNCHSKFPNTGFVFGAQRSEFTANLNSQHVVTEELGCFLNKGKVTNEKETEIRKSDPVEYIFNGKRSDMDSNSRQDRQKTSGNSVKTVSVGVKNAELDLETEHRKISSAGFVYCGDQKDSDSNFSIVEEVCSKGVENSGVDNGEETNCKTEAECVKNDSFVFVFGGNQTGKTSNFSVKKQESLNSMGKPNRDMGSLKPQTETLSASNIHPDQDCHLSNDKSGSLCTSSTANVFSTFPAHNLTDEMKKLNINNSEKVSGADITRDLKDYFVNSNNCFVFGRSEKATVSSSASSGVNADVQQSFSEPSSGQESVGNFNSGGIPECQVLENSQVNEAKASFSFSSFLLTLNQKVMSVQTIPWVWIKISVMMV